MAGQRVEEVKIQLDGRSFSFDCQLVAADEVGAIISWSNDKAAELGGFILPAHALSHAFFWHGRRHNLYRFQGQDGSPIGHRLDIIEPATISSERIVYRDLVLDIVARPHQPAVLEDEDELAEAVAGGLISSDAAAELTAYAGGVLARIAEIITESESWLRRHQPR